MNVEYLPNMGRPTGKTPPAQVDHLYKERDEDLTVILHVTRSNIHPYNPRDNHWILAWELGTYGKFPIHRRISIIRETGAEHLTNWGALTKSNSTTCLGQAVEIPMKKMSLSQRKKLEDIGNRTDVVKPNGKWNCQDWIVTVLKCAEAQGLVTRDEWTTAVDLAIKVSK
jgi:hypothetical protein